MTERKAGHSRTRTIDTVRTPASMTSATRTLADKLMEIAARRSVESPLGWACPDCETLEEAARILRGEPELKPDDGRANAVLSGDRTELHNALAVLLGCLDQPAKVAALRPQLDELVVRTAPST